MMHKLSPLNLSGLVARARADESVDGKPQKSRAEAVTMWRCTECDEVHEWKSDAEECCDPAGKPAGSGPVSCPVCGNRFDAHRDAADCCLWKDLDAITRWRVADAVDAGATWAEALGLERH
jgi:hypothetical protein